MGGHFCAHCHGPLSDGTRPTWAEHCRQVHPELAEVAGRSADWDHAESVTA